MFTWLTRQDFILVPVRLEKILKRPDVSICQAAMHQDHTRSNLSYLSDTPDEQGTLTFRLPHLFFMMMRNMITVRVLWVVFPKMDSYRCLAMQSKVSHWLWCKYVRNTTLWKEDGRLSAHQIKADRSYPLRWFTIKTNSSPVVKVKPIKKERV